MPYAGSVSRSRTPSRSQHSHANRLPELASPGSRKGNRFALYVRKSTEEDERQSQSLESQKGRALELARASGKEVSLIVEESRSAKEPGRPEFNRLLALVDAGQIDGIIAWHPDRLSRNEMDGAAITMRLRKGVLKDLAFVEYYFHNSPEGIMMLQMSLSQSQYQVSKLSVDVRRGIDDKIKKGWSPHRAPLGYVNNKGMDKGNKTISPDPDRFQTLQKAWGLLLTGAYSVGQVLSVLNDVWGFRTRVTRSGRGGQPLSKTTLYTMFSNPFYAGCFVHNGQVHKGAHEAMVTLEEFERVQALLGRGPETAAGFSALMPRMETRPQTQEKPFQEKPFLGLMRCGHCGAQITASRIVKPSGLTYTYYHCAKGAGICGKRGVRSEQVEAMIDAELSGFDLLPEFYEWAREDMARTTAVQRASQDAVQEQRQRALVEAEKQLDALTGMRMREMLNDEEYMVRRRRLVREREKLNEELRAYQDGADRTRDACLNALEYMRNARDWLRNGDPALKRIVAFNLGSNFVLTDGKLLLEPHPMLRRVGESYPGLRLEYERIEPSENGSGKSKDGGLEGVRTAWSGIWDDVRTQVLTGDHFFPKIILPEVIA